MVFNLKSSGRPVALPSLYSRTAGRNSTSRRKKILLPRHHHAEGVKLKLCSAVLSEPGAEDSLLHWETVGVRVRSKRWDHRPSCALIGSLPLSVLTRFRFAVLLFPIHDLRLLYTTGRQHSFVGVRQ